MTDSVRLIDLSVVIVNYRVKDFLEQCLQALPEAAAGLEYETIVVDNASGDDSLEYLAAKFPNVRFIANESNVGFAKANNIGLGIARGRLLAILNPDTLPDPGSLTTLVEYLRDRPKVGAVGPKLVNSSGEFDRTSKRGFPTPWTSFCRMSGLSAIFPRTRIFGGYDLLFLDPDLPAAVDSLQGACMLIRREVFETVGGLDEDFFMFGEDIDWCYRIKQAGWEVHYAPASRVIHFRGESTRRSDFDRDAAFYGAMRIFIRKHFTGRYPWPALQMLYAGVSLVLAAARTKRAIRRIIGAYISQ